MYTNKTSVEVTPACGGVEVVGVAVLPAPSIREDDRVWNEKDQGAGFQMRGLETKSLPRHNGRGPHSSLKSH